MNSLLLTITILLVLLLILLAVPVSMSFSISRNEKFQAFSHFQWLFGLVKFRIQIPTESEASKPGIRLETDKEKSHKPRNNTRGVLSIIRRTQFRQHIIKFFYKLLHSIHAHELYLRLRIGLGDPADTGMLWAAMGPLSGMMKNLNSIQVEIEPEFIDAVLEIDSHGQFQFIPLQLIALIVVFILSPTTIQAWRMTRRVNC